ncbi:MAG: 30S ribosomal protein S19e [Candidatus Huberarchaeum crystalense]|uniref:30S ribosomal protein S19e n=1 Tax=Huberarchaeum crystalense TaxID=2014257 RepID=A0A2H9RCG7_HUBC1|nr:MAG: 30S ribosomal protein S19e [Candidatus Huberarchaeum crystalense]PJC01072.1 MAG: 30S ribosomal protein S19e [Candidatus Huberarchaeum crystalense]
MISNDIQKIAENLKESIKMPEWARFVKAGAYAERQPTQENWWQLRASAILRKIALRGPIGARKLQKILGKMKNCGVKPDKKRNASGKIIRTILQQLESNKIIEQSKSKKKGRVVTKSGLEILKD